MQSLPGFLNSAWTSTMRFHHVVPGLLLLFIGCLIPLGCSRSFWRQQADQESYEAISERFIHPSWNVPRIDITPDSRSRFYDPYDPDCAPLPPDDPAAHDFFQMVQGKKGVRSWYKFGTSHGIENPAWFQSLDLSYPVIQPGEEYPENPLPQLSNLTLEQALELSSIHSREYQTQIEDLYLESLTLTGSRFQFQTRFLTAGGERPTVSLFRRASGRGMDGPDDLQLNSKMGLRKLLPAGGQIAVELANNTIWIFTGQNRTSTISALSYSLTQPLLLGAGRKIVLEELTQQERNVLYAARVLARFRKFFFTEIVSGGPSGGFLGLLQQRQFLINRKNNVDLLEEQLEILRILESQPAQLAERTFGLPDKWVQNGFPAELTGPATEEEGMLSYQPRSQELTWKGPMSLRQRERLIEMSRPTLETDLDYLMEEWMTHSVLLPTAELSDRLGRLQGAITRAREDYFRKAIEEILQRMETRTETLTVTQLESQLANARNALRQAEQGYQDRLDQFKLQLGLPPDLPMTLDESMLKPFELFDPRLSRMEREFKDFVDVWNRLDREVPAKEDFQEVILQLAELKDELKRVGFGLVKQDFKKIQTLMRDEDTTSGSRFPPRLFATTEERTRVEEDGKTDQRLFLGLQKEFEREFYYDMNSVEQRMQHLQEVTARRTLTAPEKQWITKEVAELRERMLKISQNLLGLQINLRVELIPLNPVQLKMDEAVQIGLQQRLDLMNQKANVFDLRRKVELAANELEAILDVRVEGSVGTPDGKPLGFTSSLSTIRAGLEFTAPVDQIIQRNNYRRALIDYQRERRLAMELEDNVKLQIRTSWRNLNVLKQNFETARQAIRIAARQYDNAVELTSAGGQNQGLNLLNALNSVLSAQNNLISIWVSYERSRLEFYRDMGLMQIDPQGIWVDPFYQAGSDLLVQDSTATLDSSIPDELPLDEYDLPLPELQMLPELIPNEEDPLVPPLNGGLSGGLNLNLGPDR